MTAPKKPAPAIKMPFHVPTLPQIVQMAVGLAGLVLPNIGAIPASVTHAYPWLAPALTLAAGLVLLLARKPGAPSPTQLGALVETIVQQRTSLPPTTPAADARAAAAAKDPKVPT